MLSLESFQWCMRVTMLSFSPRHCAPPATLLPVRMSKRKQCCKWACSMFSRSCSAIQRLISLRQVYFNHGSVSIRGVGSGVDTVKHHCGNSATDWPRPPNGLDGRCHQCSVAWRLQSEKRGDLGRHKLDIGWQAASNEGHNWTWRSRTTVTHVNM